MSNEESRLFDEAWIARRRLQRWAAGAVAVLVVLRLGAEFTPVLRRPDLSLLDAWQSLRATDRPSPQVVIVAVDEKSIQKFGPPPWPRSEYGPLIERLSKAGARVIGFDFTFGAVDREVAHSQVMAEAMRKAGNVVFGFEFIGVGDPSAPGTRPSASILGNALPRFESIALPPAPSLIEPEPVLAGAAAALGHVLTVNDDDGRIRQLPLVIRSGEKAYPSLALQVARLYTKTSLQETVLKNGVLSMGQWEIPVSASGEFLLNWPSAGEKAFPQHSFLDVVRGDVPDDAFRDKAVLVAGTAVGIDDRSFPFAVKAPGVLIHATFLDNVFRSDFVRAPTWAWVLEWGLFLAACGLAVGVMPRLSTPLLLAGVPALALLVVGGAAFSYAEHGLWVKAFFPVLTLVVPMGLLVALKLTESEKKTRDFAAENVESQKLLGLSFQEKGMLDMALATFNKLPMTQDMKLVFVNLGLDYENRGQRDKAQLAYKKVFDVDPAFEDVAQRMARVGPSGSGSFAATAHLGGAPTAAPASAPTFVPRPEAPTAVSASTAVLPPTIGVGAVPGPDDVTSLQPTPSPASAGTPRPSSLSVGTPTPGGSMTGTGPVLPGGRIGRYEVERHLGRGGMGDVYLVRDTVINRKAALKTIRLDTDMVPAQAIEMRQRFYREGQTAGQLAHPNIVTVYDLGEALGMSYIVMEFVEGDTLAQMMKKHRLSAAQIKHIIYYAAIGLDHAHQKGVFHRDVKPENLMVSKTGIVKVMDFGIARIVESTLTKTGSLIGTPAYMSPEHVNGEKIDARSDVFSLGVILYELLTGKKPFTGETMSSLMFAIIQAHPTEVSTVDAKLGPAWDQILGKALAKKRDDRYATAKEFAQAVRDAPVP